MARSVVPNPLERRVLLEKQLDPAHALRIAEAYLAQDRAVEALAFLRRAEARERLSTLLAQAVAAGDAFLVRETCTALGRSPTATEWQTVGEAASAAGKLRYAEQARRQQGRGEG
ncbi:MAG TPA: hypothetical protein VEG67_04425 [Myxococcota bacterium]|nr:hypothetical protein [Myxococcota bacterium]